MAEPERGEIWRTRLDPTVGDEIGKTRPAVIVNVSSIGRLNLRVVVPVTDWKDRYAAFPWMTRLDPNAANGLSKASAADAFQIRSVSNIRLTAKLGEVSEADMEAIAAAVVLMAGYELPS